MLSRSLLPTIITAARAGATDFAQGLFDAHLTGEAANDPAALAVKGRLMKDRAVSGPAAGQQAGFAAAAEAYAAADALRAQPYTRINVATLSMLAGDQDRARRIAQEIVDWLERGEPFPETPFFLAATLAEALLLLGRIDAARDALRAAIAHAPTAWEDHAVTLRQFELVGLHTGIDVRWIDTFRPPCALHYAGHLGVAARADGGLIDRIDEIIASEKVGFGFGALAAGADLTIAERVLAHGGELHVVLPLAEAAFVAQSVAPYGEDWTARFAACRDAAATWTETAADTGTFEPLASQLAADVAMGAAVRHARRMASGAVQLVVVDDGPGTYGTGAQTGRDARRWSAAGGTTHSIRVPRANGVRPSAMVAEPEGHADRRLAAMLQIDFHGLADLDEARFAEAVADVLLPLRTTLAAVAVRPEVVLPCGNSRIVAFATPEAAYDFARELLALGTGPYPVRLAGHYGLAHWLREPDALVGRSVRQLGTVAAGAIPGTLTASETFASALCLARGAEIYAEPVGEVADLRLFAIRPANRAA